MKYIFDEISLVVVYSTEIFFVRRGLHIFEAILGGSVKQLTLGKSKYQLSTFVI